MAPPFSSTNYDIINIGSAEIINRSITAVDIALATIDISNLSASCIASLSGGGGGGGLTANSVNSSHIINGSILGVDISNKTITATNIADNTITKFQIADDAITNLKINNEAVGLTKLTTGIQTILTNADRPKANLIIYNSITSTTTLNYEINLYDPLVGFSTYFIPQTKIEIGSTHSILLNLSSLSVQIIIALNTSSMSVDYYDIATGGTYVSYMDDNLIFTLDSGSNNLQVYFEVSPN